MITLITILNDLPSLSLQPVTSFFRKGLFLVLCRPFNGRRGHSLCGPRVFLLLFFSLNLMTPPYEVDAMEMSRPESFGGDFLTEINLGTVLTETEELLEVGFDFEYFVPGSHHHFSVGFATDFVFSNQKKYYFGPLVSAYFYHFKFFLSSGVMTDFQDLTTWRTRLGTGYEFIFHRTLIIPTVAIDYDQGSVHWAFLLGLAREF